MNPPLSVDTTLGHYRILGPLGRGGMGAVFKAEDLRLGRQVAIKVLAPDRSDQPGGTERLRREARAASTLNHPSICTIYEVEHDPSTGGDPFIVMELLEGETLRTALAGGPLPLDRLLDVAVEISDALDAAHAAGVFHRDVKPSNIFLVQDGHAKLLDFGVAKFAVTATDGVGRDTTATDFATADDAAAIGTTEYMSPEQLRGEAVDGRTDLFSFGAVLYEMATGRTAFAGSSRPVTIDAILNRMPEPASRLNRAIPHTLDAIIAKALEKDRRFRYQHASEMRIDLERLRRDLRSKDATRADAARRRRVGLVAAVAVLAAAIPVGSVWRASARRHWARDAAADIARLIDSAEFAAAADLARRVRVAAPGDPVIDSLWLRATGSMSIVTTPPGADVAVRPYPSHGEEWQPVGSTPLHDQRMPRIALEVRITKAGYAPVFALFAYLETVQPGAHFPIDWDVALRPEAIVPPGMRPVMGGTVRIEYPLGLNAPIVTLAPFLIDEHEVTNEQYQAFVNAGGYRRPEFWTEPFVRNGRIVPWEEALPAFRDATGRPGPAAWEVGTYPKGRAHYPVAGVSWYEAAAYARFVGKVLPTAYHWTNASNARSGYLSPLIAKGGNFGSDTQAVGAPNAASGSGTTDMAGNVKEWCWNEGRNGKHFILGGGLGEPLYMFGYTDEAAAWERRLNFGFRCARYDTPPPPEAMARIEPSAPDFMHDKPVSDDVFAAFRELYRYDRGELNVRIEESDATELWVHSIVSFDAAYGRERVSAHLFVPKHAEPPLQAIVYLPGGFAMQDATLDLGLVSESLDYVIKSGRVLMLPIYKGLYDRLDGLRAGGQPPAFWRDHVIAWSKDLGRSLDYLETRNDIDATKFGYLGFSMGGWSAPVLLAIEPRIRTAVLSSAGLQLWHYMPEVDPTNFLPRVKLPVLMLNGRYDATFPLDASQMPMFRLLGTAPRDKKHVVYEAAHAGFPHADEVRQTLDWFDKYLGVVKR